MPSPPRIAGLLAFCLVGWLLVRLARATAWLALPAAILLVLAAYLAMRLNPWLPDVNGANTGTFIGIAYVLIRILQVLVDSHEDPSVDPRLLPFLCFLLGWPWLIAGPIQRWQDFDHQRRALSTFRLDKSLLLAALARVVVGYFLILVPGDAARRVWLALAEMAFDGASPVAFGAAQVGYFVYLSFDFIGYTGIVLGLAALCGFRPPENFNRPWSSVSYLDFWTRWHMTMAGFFRTYVFSTVLRHLTYRRPARSASAANAAIALFATFFLVGLWHGVTWHFAVCGLLLGLGATVNQFWRFTVGRAANPSMAQGQRSPLATNALTVATLTYVCLSITPLWLTSLSLERAAQLVQIYGVVGFGLSILTTALAVLVAVVAYRVCMHLAVSTRRIAWLRPAMAGLAIGGIHVYRTIFPSNVVAFVYQAF
jgi:alginate O-acetyltransferase complex protein AlgI